MVRAMGLEEELIAVLDADRVVTSADERRRHGTDEGWHSAAAPDVVVYPRDSEEAAAVVKICKAHATPIVPFGAGTSLEGHVAALYGGVSIDTTRMNAVLRLSVEDMDVTVQAGVTRRQLDEKLRPEGVFFSDDRRDGGHGRVGNDIRPLRHDARERPQPHRRHRRR
jgi:D-lactate dehydrogenase (cytochrome)